MSDAVQPALSLIVAADTIHAGLRPSLESMLRALQGVPAEVIVACRERWDEAPAGVRVAVFNSASRGDRLDHGAELAAGRILAFVDDRIRLSEGWAATALEVFADPSVAVAGGPVVPRSRRRAERVTAVIVNRHLKMTPTAPVSQRGTARPVDELAGSNLLIRAEIFHAVGGFQSPTVGGESVRLCYKVRKILGREVLYHPALAVHATVRPFPGAFLAEITSYGRARGDLARRLPEVAPLIPYGLPTLATIFVVLEAALLPFHWWKAARIGFAVLLGVYLIQSSGVFFGRGRLGDRLLAGLGLPLVPLAYGYGFIRGYLGPSLGEISPPRARARPMRILIINWRDVTHPWSGGAETYMHEIGRRWAEQGLDVGWLCQRHKGSRRIEVIDGIRVHRVGGKLTLYPMVALTYLLRLRGRYDLIVDCENGIPFFTPLFARVPKVMVVHHIHQQIFRQELRPPMRWLALWLEGWLVPRIYRRTQVVAVSDSTRADLLAMGFHPDRVSIIHNGVVPPPPGRSPRAASPTILCMGRLKAQKRVDVLIRAMPAVLRTFPEARIDIIGQGPDRTRLERLAWSLGLANIVRFHGFVPAQVRDQIAARAWVAVCPSAFEGWGVVCVEASARGLPVIASNVPGLRDSVRDGETGVLVPFADAAALAVELVGLLGSPSRRLKMGAAGRRWAAQHTWERSAGELRTLLISQLPGLPRVTAEAAVTSPPAAAGPAEELQAANAG